MEASRIPTVKGYLTLEDALANQLDVIPTLKSLPQTLDFKYNVLDASRLQIEKVVARHLGIRSSKLSLSDPSHWIFGGFNICLPINIHDRRSNRLPAKVMMRVAMLHAIDASFTTGIVDEKLSRIENESWLNRAIWQVQRVLCWVRGETLPNFFPYNRESLGDLGYILIEHVEDGKILSSSWKADRHDLHKQKNLYTSLANILLDLSKHPLPRIGSWTMDNRGVLSLTNRPFHDLTAFWSRFRTPSQTSRSTTYASAYSYTQDLLAYQDARMRHQPNAILDRDDGLLQLASLVSLRTTMPQFFNPHASKGVFILKFSDLHQSNIFVDADWNITKIIDLEFAYSCPIELVHLPSWLTNRGVDELDEEDRDEYQKHHDQLVDIVAEQEQKRQMGSALSQHFRDTWISGRLWYSLCLESINAFPNIYTQHLCNRHFYEWNHDTHAWPLAQLWTENVKDFLDRKIAENEEYNEQVRRIFKEHAEQEEREQHTGKLSEEA